MIVCVLLESLEADVERRSKRIHRSGRRGGERIVQRVCDDMGTVLDGLTNRVEVYDVVAVPLGSGVLLLFGVIFVVIVCVGDLDSFGDIRWFDSAPLESLDDSSLCLAISQWDTKILCDTAQLSHGHIFPGWGLLLCGSRGSGGRGIGGWRRLFGAALGSSNFRHCDQMMKQTFG